jgi:hypothetical protein
LQEGKFIPGTESLLSPVLHPARRSRHGMGACVVDPNLSFCCHSILNQMVYGISCVLSTPGLCCWFLSICQCLVLDL